MQYRQGLDVSEKWQALFQEPASPVMEGIIEFHHGLMFVITFIAFFVLYMICTIVYSFRVMMVSALSIIVGCFGASFQKRIKRLLAYSSINNAGYWLAVIDFDGRLADFLWEFSPPYGNSWPETGVVLIATLLSIHCSRLIYARDRAT